MCHPSYAHLVALELVPADAGEHGVGHQAGQGEEAHGDADAFRPQRPVVAVVVNFVPEIFFRGVRSRFLRCFRSHLTRSLA